MKTERIFIYFFIIVIILFYRIWVLFHNIFRISHHKIAKSRILSQVIPNLAPRPFIVLLRNSSPLPSGCQTLLCCGFRFRLSLCTSGFGLLPEMCRPAADTEVSCRTKKKTLLPGYYSPQTSADQATFLSSHLNNRSNFWLHFWKWLELNWVNSSNHSHVFKGVLCENDKNWH